MKTAQLVAGIVAATVAAAVGIAYDRDEAPQTAAASPSRIPAIDSIASPTGRGAVEPNFAVAKNGDVYLSWLEPIDSGFALKFSTFKSNGWTAPTTIRSGRSFYVNWSDFPSMLVLDNGSLAVHWLERLQPTGYAYGIRLSRSNDGGRTWSTPVIPHRDTLKSGEHGFVAMWPTGGGTIGALWLDPRKKSGGHMEHQGETMLMATTLGPDGKLGPETIIDDRTCDCCANSISTTATGPIVAYRNRTSDEVRDIYVTRLVNGKWTEGVPVHNDNWKLDACPVNGPSVKASGNNVAVAWFTGVRDTNRVYVAFSSDGGAKFGDAIRVDGGDPGGRVDLVLLDDGSAVVSWLERTGGDVAAVRARRVTRSGQLRDQKTIAASSAGKASGVPRMMRAGSDIFFAWTVPTKPSSVRVARAPTALFK